MSAMRAQGQAMLDRAVGDERQEFGSFFLARLLGMSVAYEADACIVSFDAVPPLFNPRGTLHGGVLATAMDISMGHLLNHVAGPGATLEIKVQYMAAVTEGAVQCRATFLRQGRSLSFLQSHGTRADGVLVAGFESGDLAAVRHGSGTLVWTDNMGGLKGQSTLCDFG